MNTSFEPGMDPAVFTGQFTSIEIIDPVAPPMVGNKTIDPTKLFKIKVTWNVAGFNVPLFLDNANGDWVVEAYAETLGPGDELKIAEKTEVVGDVNLNPHSYTVELEVQPNTLQPYVHGPQGPSGIYRLTVSAVLDSNLSPNYDIIGFAEGVTIRAAIPG